MHKTLTAADLIAILAEYPPETPILDGKGYDFKRYDITERAYDDWDHSTIDATDNLIPAVGRAIAIGPRF